MNYLPFCGYWFYGALDAAERATYYCSYGLLATAPIEVPGQFLLRVASMTFIPSIPFMGR